MAFSRLIGAADSSLSRLVNWFIPPAIAADKESRKQAHVFLISHLLGPFIGNVVPLALFLLDPTPGYPVAVLALSITGFWVFPFLLRATGAYQKLAIASVQNLIFCILWSCYFYGGVSSPTLSWVLIIPLLAFFYVGPVPALRAIVLVQFAANIVVFGIAYALFVPVNDLPEFSQQGLGVVSTVAAALYVAMMSFYYAKILASQAELEGEVKQHLATAAELREATAAAERADAAKSEFLAKTSHELRTPLNAVIGYSEILLDEANETGDDFGVEDLERIHASGKQLLGLVNDVLDLSKIAAGKMELYEEDVEIGPTLASLVDIFREKAKANGNELRVLLEPDLGIVHIDGHKMQQIASQLLDNAVKFTENGTVTLHVGTEVRAEGRAVVVSIIDTGIGIAEEAIPHLFEVFNGAEDFSSSKYGGTGLGLALARKLAKIMGGELTVKSKLGEGSRFSVALPDKGYDLRAAGKANPLAAAA